VGGNKKEPLGSSVFVYEQPESSSALYDAAAWTMHTVSTGYAPFPKKISGPGRGSPGSVTTFHPRTTTTSSGSSGSSGGGGDYPSILVSGDDGGFVSILTPDLSSASDAGSWNYTYT
jgi:hypothetical protein